jgi:hypothetical protein
MFLRNVIPQFVSRQKVEHCQLLFVSPVQRVYLSPGSQRAKGSPADDVCCVLQVYPGEGELQREGEAGPGPDPRAGPL